MATPTTPTPAATPKPVEKEKLHDPADANSPPFDPAKAQPYVPAKSQTDEKAPAEKPAAAKPSTTYTS